MSDPNQTPSERRTEAIGLLDKVGYHPRSGVQLSRAVDVIYELLDQRDCLLRDLNDPQKFETCSACPKPADYLSLDDGTTWCLVCLANKERLP